jgi:hypothetical protein
MANDDRGDEEIRGRLERAAEPADPTGAYERVVEKKVARRIRRRVSTVGLAVVVVAATAGGTFGLTRVFGRGAEPATGSTTGFTNGLLAFSRFIDRSGRGHRGIYSVELDGSHPKLLTDPRGNADQPAWSPDGSSIAFALEDPSHSSASQGVYLMNADGSGLRKLVAVHGDTYTAWSPDGKAVYFVDGPDDKSGKLFEVTVANGQVRAIFGAEGCWIQDPAVAPDGTIAVDVQCDDGSRWIELMNPNGDEARRLESVEHPEWGPAWAPDGSVLAFGRLGTLFTVRPDGSDLRAIAHLNVVDVPTYSPDGTKVLVPTGGAGTRVVWELVDLGGSGTRQVLSAWPYALAVSWQPVPPGGVPSPSAPSPAPTSSPTVSPSPSSSATPACSGASTSITADFDGDSKPDTATVTCFPEGGSEHARGWGIDVVWGEHSAGSWSLPECSPDACRAVATIPMNDGSNALVLETAQGASTTTYEFLNVYPSELGPLEYLITAPGADGFPAGMPAILPDGGAVTHLDFFRCQGGQYPGGGDQATIVSTSAVLSQDQSTYAVTETILAHGSNVGAPELIVVSQTTRDVAFDAFDPVKDVTGVPCWDQGGSSPTP